MTDEDIKKHIEEFGWDFFEVANKVLPETVSDKHDGSRIYAEAGARLCASIYGSAPYEDSEHPEFDWATSAFIVGWDKALERLGALLGLPHDALRAAVDMTDEFGLNTMPDHAISKLRDLGPFIEGQTDPSAYYDKMGEVLGIPAGTPSPWAEKVLEAIKAQDGNADA